MGRGNKVVGLCGNENYRRVCWEFRPQYLLAHRDDKGQIAEQVLAKIASLKPPGRVIERSADGKGYYIVDPKRAIEKTCQLLREKKFKTPKGMPSLPPNLKQKACQHRPRQTTHIKALYSDENSDYEAHEKRKVVKAKKTTKHKKPDPKKKVAPDKVKKTTNTKSGTKVKPDAPSSPLSRLKRIGVSRKVVKAKKTLSKSKTTKIVSTPGKTLAPAEMTVGRNTIGKVPRRSMRNIISKSIKEVQASTTDESQMAPPETVAIASAIPSVVEIANTIVALRLDTASPSRSHFQVPRQSVMAFEQEPADGNVESGYNVESKKDEKPSSLMSEPETTGKELLRGFSGYYARDAAGFGTGDDRFERELEGIAEVPLMSLVARGVSLCSFGPGSSFEQKERESSPQGVNEMVPNPPTLKSCNSLFVEGIEGTATHGSISPAIFENDDGGDTRINSGKFHSAY